MKRIIFAGTLLLFAPMAPPTAAREQAQAPTQTQEQTQEQAGAPERPAGPHFDFEITEHDFGDIEHSLPKVECRFRFTNDGTAPLVITKILTSCSCVKADYAKRPVPPGGEGEIVITYEVSKKEPGVFYKVIEVYSNSADRRNNLIVKGNATE
ncbi:MAG: DUF1573 domain-containing protein [Alistipes sp.]|jgi:hypothetical protein|nr:DUF1573 domain-containing protein [Alistipes sp.]